MWQRSGGIWAGRDGQSRNLCAVAAAEDYGCETKIFSASGRAMPRRQLQFTAEPGRPVETAMMHGSPGRHMVTRVSRISPMAASSSASAGSRVAEQTTPDSPGRN
jgi:hypothetical protein